MKRFLNIKKQDNQFSAKSNRLERDVESLIEGGFIMSVEEKLECLREIRGYIVKISEMMVDIDTILKRISKDVRPKLETEVLTFPEMSELLSKGMIFNARYEQALLVRAISSFQSGDYVRLTYEIPEYIRFLKTQESI